MARRELAKRLRDLAPDTRTGGDPNPSAVDEITRINAGNREVKRLPEDWGDPTPDRDQEPVSAPTTAADPTDTVDELEIKIFGRDLRPSGLDQAFPNY